MKKIHIGTWVQSVLQYHIRVLVFCMAIFGSICFAIVLYAFVYVQPIAPQEEFAPIATHSSVDKAAIERVLAYADIKIKSSTLVPAVRDGIFFQLPPAP